MVQYVRKIAHGTTAFEITSETCEALPVAGTIVKVLKLGSTLQDRLFLGKLLRFYSHLTDIPFSKRVEFVNSHNDDTLGENVLHMINSITVVEKSHFLGKFFKAYILEEIDQQTFEILSASLETLRINDYEILKCSMENMPKQNEQYLRRLYTSELIEYHLERIDEGGSDGSTSERYMHSKVGCSAANILFDLNLIYDEIYNEYLGYYQLRRD